MISHKFSNTKTAKSITYFGNRCNQINGKEKCVKLSDQSKRISTQQLKQTDNINSAQDRIEKKRNLEEQAIEARITYTQQQRSIILSDN